MQEESLQFAQRKEGKIKGIKDVDCFFFSFYFFSDKACLMEYFLKNGNTFSISRSLPYLELLCL